MQEIKMCQKWHHSIALFKATRFDVILQQYWPICG